MSEETLGGERDDADTSVNAGARVYIDGWVYTEGGDFIGRDLTLSRTDDETIDIGQLKKRPYRIQVTEEGSAFGDVYTAGGHFIGRDLVIHNLEIKDIEPLWPEPCDPPCIPPYQGLLSFSKEDANRFFGRQALTTKIVKRLHDTNFLTVIGASGSGKSSVVCAGVVPVVLGWQDLPKDLTPLSGRWQDIIFTPTSQPFTQLAEKLYLQDVVAKSNFEAELRRDKGSLAKALFEATLTDGLNRLLVVDQFEELFTLCLDPSVRQAFVNNLLHIAQNPQPSLKVILALRADFYSHCFEYEELTQHITQNSVIVAQMDPEEIAEAILRPAAKGQWKLQASLVDQMLIDVGSEPGALPLLSHALLETWNHRRERIMTLSGYREAGGVDGAIARTAETVFASLSENEQLIAKRLFLRLTGVLEQETPDTRRIVNFAEIGDDPATKHVQQQLVQARLITANEQGLQVAHEALIRKWPRLQGWLDENREGLIIHRRLTVTERDWRNSHEDTGLLFRGLRLTETEIWVQNNGGEVNEREREFLIASATERERQQAAEEQRQRNETELRIQQEVKKRVQSSQLSFAAQSELTNDPERALLLAIAGLRLNIEPNAYLALTASLQSHYRTTFYGHENKIVSAIFSPDEQAILTISWDGTARLWDRQGNELSILRGHEGSIFSAVFDLDGQIVLTASHDSTARLWDRQGNELVTLRGHDHQVNSAVFSPDGQTILTASGDATARLWDQQGNILGILQGHEGWVNSAVFSPDGKTILTASNDGTAKLWDRQGHELAVLRGHVNMVSSAVFSPDGQKILTASWDGTARLWDKTGQMLSNFHGHRDSVRSATFSPDGQTILTAGCDGTDALNYSINSTLRLWDLQGNQLMVFHGHEEAVNLAVFSPDGQAILSASDDGTARLWDRHGNELLVLRGHNEPVNSAYFSTDGHILTASGDTARLWNKHANKFAVLHGHGGGVNSAVFSPNGQTILSSSDDGTVKLWDQLGNELVVLRGHDWGVSSAVFDPDGELILTASNDGTAKLWDRHGKELAVLRGHNEWVSSAVFSLNGQSILTAGCDEIDENHSCIRGTARLWDRQGNEVTILYGHEDVVSSAVFSSDSKSILTASWDSTARLWNQQGNELTILRGHEDKVNSAIFSPDDQNVLTASTDYTARLWDRQGNELTILRGHEGGIYSAVFSRDGQMILTASNDGTARLWDRQGSELAILRGNEDIVKSATFSPDGQTILVAGCTGEEEMEYIKSQARLWDLQGVELAILSGRHKDSVKSAIFSPDGLAILTASRDGSACLWPTITYMVREAYRLIKRGFTGAECQQYFRDDLAACPRTKEELFAPLAHYLTNP